MAAFGAWPQVRGSFFRRLLVGCALQAGTAAGTVIAVSVRRDVDPALFGGMAIFTRMIDAAVICAQVIEV